MSKVESFELNLKSATTNYKNSNIPETIKNLDLAASIMLDDDKSLDNFTKDMARYVLEAVVLNQLYLNGECNGNVLDGILVDVVKVKENVDSFYNNFQSNIEISFVNFFENMHINQIEKIQHILMMNFGGMNIKVEKQENKNNDNVIECVNCSSKFKIDWSKVPNTERIIYTKCPKCGASLSKNNPNYVDVENSTELKIELMDFIKNASGINVFTEWNKCKRANPEFIEFFEVTEEQALKEIIEAQNDATVLNRSLKRFVDIYNETNDKTIINNLIVYFGIQSIYERKIDFDFELCQSLSIDNVILFRATLIINIVAIMQNNLSTSNSPLGLKLIFEHSDYIEVLKPIIREFFPNILPQMGEIRYLSKD